MPKIDHHEAPVRFDRDARGRLAAALDRDELAVAYLFGSQAQGRAAGLSDVDVAVLLDLSIDPEERLSLQLELIAVAARTLRSSRLDLVILDDAPVLLRHRVVRDGERLLERDRARRVRFETATILEYLDTKPLRSELARGVRRRLAEGTFGRR